MKTTLFLDTTAATFMVWSHDHTERSKQRTFPEKDGAGSYRFVWPLWQSIWSDHLRKWLALPSLTPPFKQWLEQFDNVKGCIESEYTPEAGGGGKAETVFPICVDIATVNIGRISVTVRCDIPTFMDYCSELLLEMVTKWPDAIPQLVDDQAFLDSLAPQISADSWSKWQLIIERWHQEKESQREPSGDVIAKGTPRVPKRPTDLRRWKATWRVIKPHAKKGMPATEIEAWLKKTHKQLVRSPETLNDIIRAGEVGLLED